MTTAYKGFDLNLQCRGMQYEIGQTYTHDGPAVACRSGFHACKYPLSVFGYYPPAGSRFAVVEQGGEVATEGDKRASTHITVSREITLADLTRAAVEYTQSRALPIDPASPASATGEQGAASATGRRGAASATGEQGAASATGWRGAASATGDQGAASATGTQGAASATGDQGAASATGPRGAASATGTQGAASATGPRGAASATGWRGAASATGWRGRAMGAEGCALFLVHRADDGEITHAWAGIVGKKGIKPGVWYTLNAQGEPEEVTE